MTQGKGRQEVVSRLLEEFRERVFGSNLNSDEVLQHTLIEVLDALDEGDDDRAMRLCCYGLIALQRAVVEESRQ